MWCNTFPHSLLYSKSKIKEKKRKENINNNLVVLPSHDIDSHSYSDANWGTNLTDRRSVSGYAIMFGEEAIS